MRQRLPLISLILINTIPLFGVLFLGWNASMIIFLYWFENVIIGIYNVIKITLAENSSNMTARTLTFPSMSGKAFTAIFFMIHYGIFTVTHGIFVAVFFISDLTLNSSLIFAMLMLFVSHGMSFLVNYIGNKEYQRMSPDILMKAPYKRVVVMHLTIIFGAMIALGTGQSMLGLLLLVLLKIIADIFSHTSEHTKIGTYILKPNWVSKKLQGKLNHDFLPIVEDAFEASIKSGQFDELKKNVDPEIAEYIEKYFSTPKEERDKLKPPKIFIT